MRNDLRTLLKPTAIKRYQAGPLFDILQASPAILKALSKEQVRKLSANHLLTLEDLLMKWETLPLEEIHIDIQLIEKLRCIFFHPQYDPGPNCAWEWVFRSAPLDYYLNYPQHPFHVRFGPVFYRGRLDGTARVLVIGQDPATDETLGQRVFLGQAGQIAQNFLSKLGLTRSYVMFNTFLFGIQSSALSDGSVTATDATIMAYRNKLFDRVVATNNLVAIIAFGAQANTSALNWPGRGSLPLIHLTHPTAPNGVAANWNDHLAYAQSVIAADSDGHVDATPYNPAQAMPTTDIPRRDLPFGIPGWHGTGGDTHSQRGSQAAFETQIKWNAP